MQTRWLEFLKSDDIHFQYRSGKVNLVVDTLSRWPYPTLSCLLELPSDLHKEFYRMELNVITPGTQSMLNAMEVQPTLIEEIRIA